MAGADSGTCSRSRRDSWDLGTLKESFAPPGGLLAEQQVVSGGVQPGGGRLADIAPSLGEWWERPLVGHGFGTRVTVYDPGTGQLPNAIILDNQWLGLFLKLVSPVPRH